MKKLVHYEIPFYHINNESISPYMDKCFKFKSFDFC